MSKQPTQPLQGHSEGPTRAEFDELKAKTEEVMESFQETARAGEALRKDVQALKKEQNETINLMLEKEGDIQKARTEMQAHVTTVQTRVATIQANVVNLRDRITEMQEDGTGDRSRGATGLIQNLEANRSQQKDNFEKKGWPRNWIWKVVHILILVFILVETAFAPSQEVSIQLIDENSPFELSNLQVVNDTQRLAFVFATLGIATIIDECLKFRN